jgi:hypothetical protein
MLWGQTIKVYTDHKNLTCDALVLTSDRVYCWRLLLKEFAPKVNPTSEFNYSTFGVPAKGETTTQWKTFSKLWQNIMNITQARKHMNAT